MLLLGCAFFSLDLCELQQFSPKAEEPFLMGILISKSFSWLHMPTLILVPTIYKNKT
jgi:hypothetical protein